MAMVPAPTLHIDIFVTNAKPLAPPRYNTEHSFPPAPSPSRSRFPLAMEGDDLAPPTPGFARDGRPSNHSRRNSTDSMEEAEDSVESYVDLSYYTGEHSDDDYGREGGFYDHENHILDLTNFDGDNDEALPGEEVLNRTVKKQGTLRRAKTRKATRATQAAKQRLHERRANAEAKQIRHVQPQTHVQTMSSESALSTDRLLSHGSPRPVGIEHRLSATPEIDLGSPTAAHSETPWHVPGVHSPPTSPDGSKHSHSEGMFTNWDARSDTASFRTMIPQVEIGGPGDGVRLEVEEREMHDINVVSEHARPGKPKLDRIVADEVENSKGSTIVACESSL